MKRIPTRFTAGSICAAMLLLVNLACAAQTVRTDKGLVEGVPTSDPAVTVFRGIPYAAPPVGNLRWSAPQSAHPWQGVLHADRFSRSCMQAAPSSMAPWTEEYMDQNERSEDCLYLNVWTTGTTGKRPVMVWIHGGGFEQGSTSVALYDGQELARKGIVVVSMNYRLGVFGFFALPQLTSESPDHASGNYGILDQIAALKWVHDNIAAFGGDPAQVTIAGQSAGAMSVQILTASPLARGLFHRAIAESGWGAGAMTRSLADVEAEGTKFMAAKGAATLKELRAMPVYLLMAPVPGETYRWGPVVDGWMLPERVSAIYAQGRQNDVATMAGWCADEGSPFPKYGKLTPAEFAAAVRQPIGSGRALFFGLAPAGDLADEFLKLYPNATQEESSQSQKESIRDQNMVSTFVWATERSLHARTPVYTYLWDHPLPGPDSERYGSFHSAELPYVFDSLADVKRPWTQKDHSIAETTSSYWANFVKTGNPNGDDLPNWPVFNPGHAVTMELGDHFGARPIATPAQVKLLEEIRARTVSAQK